MVISSPQVRSSRSLIKSSVIQTSKKPPCSTILNQIQWTQLYLFISYWLMLLQWALILAVTSVSVTMLMIIGSYLAILPEAEEFYNVSRTKVLLLANIFNIGYILITPFIFNLFHKHYIKGILIATVATAVGAVGRYVAEENYNLSLAMTSIVAVSHIPIITAPYGLLKLFPDWQKGYAASIPLFLPVLGINFCILYGMAYIADDGSHSKTINEVHAQISGLNQIIAIVGLLASTATVILTLMLKNKIQQEPHAQKHQQLQEVGSTTEGEGSAYNPKEVEVEHSLPQIQRKQPQNEGAFQGIVNMVKKLFSQKRTAVLVISWGIIVGINWTYGALFGVIFSGQNLTGKEIALIGLAANLSSAIFSNLGTFIKNRFNLENIVVIEYLNIFGIAAAIVIQFSRFMEVLQGLYFMIFLIIVLRAGLSSFVSLAFVEMEKQGMSSLIVSAFFFWVANLSNLAGMEIVDLVVVDLSLFLLTLTAGICVYVVNRHQYMECSRSI